MLKQLSAFCWAESCVINVIVLRKTLCGTFKVHFQPFFNLIEFKSKENSRAIALEMYALRIFLTCLLLASAVHLEIIDN
jgi:hypothetical protein